jgi:outer membrane lipoprotein-sorting protein
MNEPDLLEQELNSFGDELRAAPSVAVAVLGILAQDVVVPATADCTERTAERPISRRFARRLQGRLRPRFMLRAASVAAAVVCAALAALLLQTDSVALAQVRDRLAAVRTASLSITRSIVARFPDGQSGPRTIRQRLFLRADGRVRTEGPQQITTILSPDDFIRLELDAEHQTATRRYIYENENQRDVITALRTLHESVEAIKLPVREFEGVHCPGFRIEERDSTLLVWVDPETRLPRHAERSYAKALAADDGDVQEIVETYHDMRFDEPLADELFALTPPAGYAVTTVGTPPADRKQIFAEPPVATPNVGVGPLKFGMPRAEIVRLLGKPDAEDVHVPQFTVSDDTTRLDDKERPAGASLVVLTELHTLHYNALGLWLTVEAVEGLRGIACFGQERLGVEGQTFPGATDKGIRIGSSKTEVLEAYGQPDEVRFQEGVLSYARLHLEFTLTPEQTVGSINMSDSYEHRLRFEWRLPSEAEKPPT